MYDLIIIGAGPAGLTAAIYAGRFRLKTLLLEKMSPGGQIMLSPSIENYPGFPEGISSFDLMNNFKTQVDSLGVEIKMEEVLGIANSASGYSIKTPEASYEAKSIILASGAQSKRLSVLGEDKFIGRGVSYCGTCDGPLYRNKKVVVVGGGDRALEDAIFLATYASQVTLVHRRQEFRASKILQEKLRHNEKINFALDCVVEEICGDAKVNMVKVRNVKNNSLAEISCDGVFIFVGIKPNTEFLKKQLPLDEFGFIITAPDAGTGAKGVFACGDCCKKSLYQVVTACGEGAIAADSAHKYLLNT